MHSFEYLHPANVGGAVADLAHHPDSKILAGGMTLLPTMKARLAAPSALGRLRLERSLLARETAILQATTSRPAPDFAFERFSQN